MDNSVSMVLYVDGYSGTYRST